MPQPLRPILCHVLLGTLPIASLLQNVTFVLLVFFRSFSFSFSPFSLSPFSLFIPLPLSLPILSCSLLAHLLPSLALLLFTNLFVGSYSSQSGSTSCTQCAVNSFNPFNGQSLCAPCGQGSYASSTGSTSCQTGCVYNLHDNTYFLYFYSFF